MTLSLQWDTMVGMRRTAVLNVVLLSVVLGAGCGGTTCNEACSRADIRVEGISLGYVPEVRALRVGWLPVTHESLTGYQVSRIGPLALDTEVTGVVDPPEAIGIVSDTTYDDPDIAENNQYGYAVAAMFNDGTTSSPSRVRWIGLEPGTIRTVPQVAPQFEEICTPVTEQSTFSGYALQPSDVSRPGPVNADGQRPHVSLTGRVFKKTEYRVRWLKYIVGQKGGQVLSSNPLAEMAVGDCIDRGEELVSFSDVLSNADVYAVGAELQVKDKKRSEEEETNVVDTVSIVRFPKKPADTTDSLRLQNETPPPGTVLQKGFHQISAEIQFDLERLDGKVLHASTRAISRNGQETLLDVRLYEMQDTSGSFQYAAAVTIPDDELEYIGLRMVGRVSTGKSESVWVEDVVDYAVVP